MRQEISITLKILLKVLENDAGNILITQHKRISSAIEILERSKDEFLRSYKGIPVEDEYL